MTVLDALADVCALADGRPLDEAGRAAVAAARARLDGPLRVGVVGEPGAGSTSLVAALLGRPVVDAAPAWHQWGDVLVLDAGRTDAPDAVDVAVHVLVRRHPDDPRVLGTLATSTLAPSTPATAIAVLGRADEVGGGGPDAVARAAPIAQRLAAHPKLRTRCATVVPVAVRDAAEGRPGSGLDHLLAVLDDVAVRRAPVLRAAAVLRALAPVAAADAQVAAALEAAEAAAPELDGLRLLDLVLSRSTSLSPEEADEAVLLASPAADPPADRDDAIAVAARWRARAAAPLADVATRLACELATRLAESRAARLF